MTLYLYSSEYSRVKECNSYSVQLEMKLDSGEDVVQIRYFLVSGNKRVYVFVIHSLQMVN